MPLSGLSTDGFVGMFQTPDEGAAVTTRLNSLPVLTVSESTEVTKAGIISNAVLNVTNIDILVGTIKGIIVTHSLTNSNYETIGNFTLPTYLDVGEDQTAQIVIRNISYKPTGVTHYFRIWFFNSDGDVAVNGATSTHFGTIEEGQPVYVDHNCLFNGINDLEDYPSVKNLTCANASDTEGGAYSNPSLLPSNGTVRLTWDDMTASGEAYVTMADGTLNVKISEKNWRKTEGYYVFMYVSAGHIPEHECPIADTSGVNDGVWYNVGFYKENTAIFQVPRNVKVAFFVCAKIPLLTGHTSVVLAAETKPAPYTYTQESVA